jgi:hypothetical protein
MSVFPETVEAIRSACNSTVSRLLLPARIGQLARHRSIPVIPVGNIPENAPFRACKLPRRQAETGEKALGKRRPNHRFRERSPARVARTAGDENVLGLCARARTDA